jgi:hypothetical protein
MGSLRVAFRLPVARALWPPYGLPEGAVIEVKEILRCGWMAGRSARCSCSWQTGGPIKLGK